MLDLNSIVNTVLLEAEGGAMNSMPDWLKEICSHHDEIIRTSNSAGMIPELYPLVKRRLNGEDARRYDKYLRIIDVLKRSLNAKTGRITIPGTLNDYYDTRNKKITENGEQLKREALNYRTEAEWLIQGIEVQNAINQGGEDKTLEMSAEKYRNLSPINAVLQLMKDTGGYDERTIRGLLFFPLTAPRDFKSNQWEMKLIVTIGRHMLLLFREAMFAKQQEISQWFNIPNEKAFEDILLKSAGNKVTGAPNGPEKFFQGEFMNFVNGTCKYVSDVLPPAPVTTPKKPSIIKTALNNIVKKTSDLLKSPTSTPTALKTGVEDLY